MLPFLWLQSTKPGQLQVRNSLAYVPWKDRKAVAAALRAVYNAESETAARAQLDAFDLDWGKRFPLIARSWRANWEQLTGFLAFPLEVRKLIYTTNAIESLNFQLCKVIKSKGHFPSKEAAIKLLFLALRNIERRWTRPHMAWRQAYAQLAMFFGDRLPNPT